MGVGTLKTCESVRLSHLKGGCYTLIFLQPELFFTHTDHFNLQKDVRRGATLCIKTEVYVYNFELFVRKSSLKSLQLF